MNKQCIVSNHIADKKEKLCCIFLLLFIFQGVLEEYFPPFTYFDEVVALVIFMSGIYYRYNVKKIAIEKWEWIIGLLTIVYRAVGLVSSIMYGYQSKVVSILSFYYLSNGFYY